MISIFISSKSSASNLCQYMSCVLSVADQPGLDVDCRYMLDAGHLTRLEAMPTYRQQTWRAEWAASFDHKQHKARFLRPCFHGPRFGRSDRRSRKIFENILHELLLIKKDSLQ